MKTLRTKRKPRRLAGLAHAVTVVSLVLALAPGLAGGVAMAAPVTATAPGLGAAAGYSALGKAGVTNAGNSVLSGSVGADNMAAITGFPPGSAAGGFFAAPDVNQAEADVLTADLALTAQAGSATPTGPNLTGLTLVPGVYGVGAALLPGVLTLDGPGVYVFLATALTTSGSVSLINGATPCNVFWHVDSEAVITGGSFVGTIIAGTSVTLGDGASLNGRALALTGNVTLINNAIFGPNCSAATSSGPSHVSVWYECVDDGRVAVTVGVSAGVIVYGLGDDITSAQDTVENRIVRYLPAGRYEWHASPPAAHYMLDVAEGVIDAANCAPAAIAAATTLPVLIPVTGVDLSEARALASRHWMRFGLGGLGLGLLLLGLKLRRKQAE